MSVSLMEKITVIVPREESDALLRALMRLGVVSLSAPAEAPSEALPDNSAACAARLARIEAVLPPLRKAGKQKRRLFALPTPIDTDAFVRQGRDRAAWQSVCEAEELLARRADLLSAIEREQRRMSELAPYLSLTLPLAPQATKTTVLLLGSLPRGTRLERAEEALAGLAAELSPVSHDKSGIYLSLLVHESDLDAAEQALAPLGFVRAPFAGEMRSAAALHDRAKRTAMLHGESLQAVERRLSALARELSEIEALYDLERTALLAEQSKQQLTATKSCVILTGWTPTRARARIERVLESFTSAYEFVQPEKKEPRPRLMSDSEFVSPLKAALGLYAYPKYGGFDPAILLGVFYALAFGFFFADAGAGLVLSVACLLAAHFGKQASDTRHLLYLLGFASLSSLLFGLLFGNAFGGSLPEIAALFSGKTPADFPALLQIDAVQKSILAFVAPLRSPLLFALAALGVGGAVLLVALVLRTVVLCRTARGWDALLELLPSLLLLGGGAVLPFSLIVGFALMAAALVLSLATHGRRERGLLARLKGGLCGLRRLAVLVLDLICYARAAVIALASLALSLLAGALGIPDDNALLTLLFTLIAFLACHLICRAIDALAALVLAHRLRHASESGDPAVTGGTPFVPMRPSERYTRHRPEAASNRPNSN